MTRPSAASELLRCLEEERDAARRADLPALVMLADRKCQAVEALRTEHTPRDLLAMLVQRWEENIPLLRHLAACLRAIAGANEQEVYGPAGAMVEAVHRFDRGAL